VNLLLRACRPVPARVCRHARVLPSVAPINARQATHVTHAQPPLPTRLPSTSIPPSAPPPSPSPASPADGARRF
jgi:hypothetical protein